MSLPSRSLYDIVCILLCFTFGGTVNLCMRSCLRERQDRRTETDRFFVRHPPPRRWGLSVFSVASFFFFFFDFSFEDQVSDGFDLGDSHSRYNYYLLILSRPKFSVVFNDYFFTFIIVVFYFLWFLFPFFLVQIFQILVLRSIGTRWFLFRRYTTFKIYLLIVRNQMFCSFRYPIFTLKFF